VSASNHSTYPIRTYGLQARLRRGLSLLGTALLALAAACDSASSPQAPEDDPVGGPVPEAAVTAGPLPGKIAFTASDGVQNDIYVMNADGSNLTRLTSTPEREFEPAWSWDNSKIAFLRPRTDASAQVHPDVFVVDANGANGHWASSTPSGLNLRAPAWSPDGSRLLVSASGAIMSMDLATGALTHFKNGQQDVTGLYASFDATGQKVVVAGGGISVYHADGSGRIGVQMASPHIAAVENPSFAPDGTTILLTEAITPERRKLYLFAGTTFTLLSNSGIGIGASWAPDGKQIVFGNRRGHLSRMSAGGNQRVELAGTGGVDNQPAYSH